jgi:uncharacterized damage-inducible protein DinB
MVVGDLIDARRSEPEPDAEERAMLESGLDYHRTTLLLKCEGLSDAQLNMRPVATSLLSLHGLVRHMSEVELYWTSTVFRGNPAKHYGDEAHPEADFEDLGTTDFTTSRRLWEAQIHDSDELMHSASLDQLSKGRETRVSLRWILTHLIEEYARHNGHADLIREMVDGAVGC